MIKNESKTLVRAFIAGAIEVSNTMGTQTLYNWLRAVGEKLGEMEGGGMEGRKKNDLYYHPICPFTALLETAHCQELIKKENSYAEIPREEGVDKPACADIICIMHHAYMKKRAEL
ncbi:MAG: hypothetical protein ACXQT5_07675, partial [Candidatus Syntropharchaeia archaeon]